MSFHKINKPDPEKTKFKIALSSKSEVDLSVIFIAHYSRLLEKITDEKGERKPTTYSNISRMEKEFKEYINIFLEALDKNRTINDSEKQWLRIYIEQIRKEVWNIIISTREQYLEEIKKPQ